MTLTLKEKRHLITALMLAVFTYCFYLIDTLFSYVPAFQNIAIVTAGVVAIAPLFIYRSKFYKWSE